MRTRAFMTRTLLCLQAILAGVVLNGLASSAVFAQTAQVDYIGIVSWPAVTQNSDNSPVTIVKYQIFASQQAIPDNASGTPAEVANLTTWTHSVKSVPGTKWNYRVRACSANGCGPLSPTGVGNVGTPVILPKAPGAAPSVTVTVTIATP